jgi:hypothetical protein
MLTFSGCALDGIANIPLFCLWLHAQLQASNVRDLAYLRAVEMFHRTIRKSLGASLRSVLSLPVDFPPMTSSQDGIVMGLSGDDILQGCGKMGEQQPTLLSSTGTSSCTCVGGSTREQQSRRLSGC